LPGLSAQTDKDPIIKEQFANNDWLNTLVIKKDPKAINQYIVAYNNTINHVFYKHITYVTVVNGKIDSVW
jgi:hypothetical protein